METPPLSSTEPDFERLPPKLHMPSPYQLPRRDSDDILADLSPTSTLEAFHTPSGKLKRTVESASLQDRAFGIRATLACKNINEWVRQLSNWPWPQEGGSAGFEVPVAKRRQLSADMPSSDGQTPYTSVGLVDAEPRYLGSLLREEVARYEKRIAEIYEEMDELKVDEIKRQVLEHHISPSRPSSSAAHALKPSLFPSYNQMDDFTAIVTATVLQVLPNLARLMRLMDVWTIRLSVLRKVPSLLLALDDMENHLKLGWKALEVPAHGEDQARDEELGSDNFSRSQFEKMRSALQTKVTILGRDVDHLLDTLEGREDTLPDTWLDRMDNLERDYAQWSVAGDQKVREGEWAKMKQAQREQQAKEAARVEEQEKERIRVEEERAAQEAAKLARLDEAESRRLATEAAIVAAAAEVTRRKAEEARRREIEVAEATESGRLEAEQERLEEESVARELTQKQEVLRKQQETEAARVRILLEAEAVESSRQQEEGKNRLVEETSIGAAAEIDQEEQERNRLQKSAADVIRQEEERELVEAEATEIAILARTQGGEEKGQLGTESIASSQTERGQPEEPVAQSASDVAEKEYAQQDVTTREADEEILAKTVAEQGKWEEAKTKLEAEDAQKALEAKQAPEAKNTAYAAQHESKMQEPEGSHAVQTSDLRSEAGSILLPQSTGLSPLHVHGQLMEDQHAQKTSTGGFDGIQDTSIGLKDLPSPAESAALPTSSNNMPETCSVLNKHHGHLTLVPSPPQTPPGASRSNSALPIINSNSRSSLSPDAEDDKSPRLESLPHGLRPSVSTDSLSSTGTTCHTEGLRYSIFADEPMEEETPLAPAAFNVSELPKSRDFAYEPHDASHLTLPNLHPMSRALRFSPSQDSMSSINKSDDASGYSIDSSSSEGNAKQQVAPASAFDSMLQQNGTAENIESSDPPALSKRHSRNLSVVSEFSMRNSGPFHSDLSPLQNAEEVGPMDEPLHAEPSRLSRLLSLNTGRQHIADVFPHDRFSSTDGSQESSMRDRQPSAFSLAEINNEPADVLGSSIISRRRTRGDTVTSNASAATVTNRDMNSDSPASGTPVVRQSRGSTINTPAIPPSASPVAPHGAVQNFVQMFEDSPSAGRDIKALETAPNSSSLRPSIPPRRPHLLKSPVFSDTGSTDSSRSSAEGMPYDSPDPISRTHSSTKGTDDQFQQKISSILQKIPAHIRLTSEQEESQASDSLHPRKTRRAVTPSSRSRSSLGSRAATPSFTLAPAHSKNNPRPRNQPGNPEIKLYHLSRSTGEAPIKLFVRLVGEHGERVMVRVGGGWADLGEYLKEYASHHRRRADSTSEDKIEISDMTRIVSTNSNIARNSGRASPLPLPRSRPNTAVSRPSTAMSEARRPSSSLAVRKTRQRSSAGEQPPMPPMPPQTPIPMPTRSHGHGYGVASGATPSSIASSGRSRSSSTRSSGLWTEEEASLGLAGPRGSERELEQRDVEWVESIKVKVRQASAEKDREREKAMREKESTGGSGSGSAGRDRGSSFGELAKMGTVGGTKRVFRKGGGGWL